MEMVMGLVIGVGLSAACGFRLFVPFLGLSIASLAGHLTLASGFEWIGTWTALLVFATATVLEIGAYYVPWLDNLLDVAATPAAIVAGTLLVAAQVGDMSPLLKWSLAAIAGGGVAAVVQGGSVAVRATATGTTAGLGNFVVATIELVASFLVTLLAIVVPMVCLIAVTGLCYAMLKRIFAARRKSPNNLSVDESSLSS